MKNIALHVLVAAIAVTGQAAAQDLKKARSDYSIRYWTLPVEPLKADANLPRAEFVKFRSTLERMMVKIAASQEFKSPAEARCHHASVELPHEQPAAPAPARGRVALVVLPWDRVACKDDMYFAVAGAPVDVNNLDAVTNHPGRPDALGKFYPWRGDMPASGIFHHPNRTIITRPGAAPLLVPVTKERYLKFLLAQTDKRVKEGEKGAVEAAKIEKNIRNMPTQAQMYEKWLNVDKPAAMKSMEEGLKALKQIGKTDAEIATQRKAMMAQYELMEAKLKAAAEKEQVNPPKPFAMSQDLKDKSEGLRNADYAELESVREQLRTLSPERLAEPACQEPRVRARFDECTGGVTLVAHNPAFFDSALPRGEVQLLVIAKAEGTRFWDLLKNGTFLQEFVK